MKTLLKILGVLVILITAAAGGLYAWASSASASKLGRVIDTHLVEFPVPFPLDSAEAAGLLPEEAEALALERAVERGRHLTEARYACVECHGEDMSGGVMVDAPIMGRMYGPNLTGGAGSRAASFTAADWDRIVRHGILPGGHPSAMPSQDFQRMSDQELSDVIAYLRSLPPVDNEVAPVTLGPLGKLLVATGQLRLSADEIGEHGAPHRTVPPVAEATVEFGEHLAGTCTGCHGPALAGGPIVGGDPSWPPAANLTPAGLGSWSYDQFVVAMREARRPDGSEMLPPMSGVAPFARNMTDVEMEALWLYLQAVPAVATPE